MQQLQIIIATALAATSFLKGRSQYTGDKNTNKSIADHEWAADVR